MIIFPLFSGKRHSQNQSDAQVNRKAYAAGRFYSDDAQGLRSDMEQLFNKAIPKKYSHVQAILVPHAGYTYSGVVAASGYNQIDSERSYEHIFIIASSHTAYYEGASIYNQGNYETPFGELEVDIELANKLIEENDVFSYEAKAHTLPL